MRTPPPSAQNRVILGAIAQDLSHPLSPFFQRGEGIARPNAIPLSSSSGGIDAANGDHPPAWRRPGTTGLVLPKELLARLGLTQGDGVFVSDGADHERGTCHRPPLRRRQQARRLRPSAGHPASERHHPQTRPCCATAAILALAEGDVDEAGLARWIADRIGRE